MKIQKYWLVHIYDTNILSDEEAPHDCFRVFTDISLLLRSIQRHLRGEVTAHSTWALRHVIWYICEEPKSIRDVTVEMRMEADHAVFGDRVHEEEEPSPSPIFAAGRPL